MVSQVPFPPRRACCLFGRDRRLMPGKSSFAVGKILETIQPEQFQEPLRRPVQDFPCAFFALHLKQLPPHELCEKMAARSTTQLRDLLGRERLAVGYNRQRVDRGLRQSLSCRIF